MHPFFCLSLCPSSTLLSSTLLSTHLLTKPPQLSLEASYVTSTWHRGPDSLPLIKLLPAASLYDPQTHNVKCHTGPRLTLAPHLLIGLMHNSYTTAHSFHTSTASSVRRTFIHTCAVFSVWPKCCMLQNHNRSLDSYKVLLLWTNQIRKWATAYPPVCSPSTLGSKTLRGCRDKKQT